jgi:hypothetical protein
MSGKVSQDSVRFWMRSALRRQRIVCKEIPHKQMGNPPYSWIACLIVSFGRGKRLRSPERRTGTTAVAISKQLARGSDGCVCELAGLGVTGWIPGRCFLAMSMAEVSFSGLPLSAPRARSRTLPISSVADRAAALWRGSSSPRACPPSSRRRLNHDDPPAYPGRPTRPSP